MIFNEKHIGISLGVLLFLVWKNKGFFDKKVGESPEKYALKY